MSEWVVVADSSPLIGLARIGHLEALMAYGIYIHRALLDAVLEDLGES